MDIKSVQYILFILIVVNTKEKKFKDLVLQVL